MLSPLYKKAGLQPQNLSRTLEDAATVVGPMIPWNVCGALHAAALGVATVSYSPYCFFNMLSPLMAIIFAVFSIKIARVKKEDFSGEGEKI
jgi:NhaC family Na+:H+ antiporter